MIGRFFLVIILMIPLFCNADIDFCAKHKQQGFVQKVDWYAHRVKSMYEGRVEINDILEKAVLLGSDESMRTIAALLNQIGPILIKDKTEEEREICCAALLKIVAPIVEQFNKGVFLHLHEIDRCLQYWEYQLHHPTSYFFHKSLLKHFTLGQREEVMEKIQFLKEEQRYQYTLLGKINIHLSTFGSDLSVEQKYAWIHQVCSILFSYDTGLVVSKHAEMFPLLSEATNVVRGYHKYMGDRLYKFYIPNVITRKWLYFIGATAGLGWIGSYVKNNQADLKQKVTGLHKTVSEESKKHIHKYKTALFGDAEEEKILLSSYKSIIEDLNEIKQYSYKSIIKELHEIKKQDEKNDKNDSEFDQFWIKFIKQFKNDHIEEVIKDDDFNSMWNDVPAKWKKDLDKHGIKNSDFETFWNDIPEQVDEVKEIDPIFAKRIVRYVGFQLPALLEKLGLNMKKTTENFSIGAQIIVDQAGMAAEKFEQKPGLMNAGNTVAGMQTYIQGLSEGMKKGLVPITQGMHYFEKVCEAVENDTSLLSKGLSFQLQLISKENRIGLALLYSTPIAVLLGGIGFGSYKLYKKMQGVPNYDSVRAALIDIALLLNLYGDARPEEMDECDFGKLSYLVYKLQSEEATVPKQYRSSFVHEILLLKTAGLTADQKMKTIELLFKKYPFLVHQGMVVT